MSSERILILLDTLKSNLRVFSGNANRPLAEEIVKDLGTQLGSCRVFEFIEDVNGRLDVLLMDKWLLISMRTFVVRICSLSSLMISTSRRASARRITAVIPYYGYARQDRKVDIRSSL